MVENPFTKQERKNAKAMYLDNKGRHPRKHNEDREKLIKHILGTKASTIKFDVKVTLLEPLN